MARRRRVRRSEAAAQVEARVARLRDRVSLDALDRPAVYRMLSPDGEIVYVGKARKLRTRLLSYFRAAYPADKGARIIREAGTVEWDYQPSEFAALLEELRAIKRWRPRLNVAMKRDAWHYAFVRLAPHPAPRFQVVRGAGSDAQGVYYGPFSGAHQIGEALRELNDALGLRDCRMDQPMHFADQVELPVARARTPGCIRYEVGKCLGPCVAAVSHADYAERVALARAFLEGTDDAPIASMRTAMTDASDRLDFERAAVLRDKLARLESLREQFARLRFALDSLSFVYEVPGAFEQDRVYIIHRGRVRADLPAARDAGARDALADAVESVFSDRRRTSGPVPAHEVDELMLLAAWFRKFPHELERTVPPTAFVRKRTA